MQSTELNYRGYHFEHAPGWVGIFHDQRYLGYRECHNDAVTFIDDRISKKRTQLIHLEILAMADKASSTFGTTKYYPYSVYESAGAQFYELQTEALIGVERDISNNILTLLHDTHAFLWGYQQMQDNSHSWGDIQYDKEIAAEVYYKKKQKEKADKRSETAVDILNGIDRNKAYDHYDDLLTIPENIIASLLDLETRYVCYLENNDEYIDGRTSGHHADIQRIFENVADKKPFHSSMGAVYISDDGRLCFNLIKHLKGFINSGAIIEITGIKDLWRSEGVPAQEINFKYQGDPGDIERWAYSHWQKNAKERFIGDLKLDSTNKEGRFFDLEGEWQKGEIHICRFDL